MPPKRRRRRKASPRRRAAREELKVKLPSKPKSPNVDPQMYTGLLYGREKIGKTTFLSQWPEVLFLATEPGTKGLEIFEVQIPDWKTLLATVRALEKEPDRFKTIVIDTVDLAYDMCMDYTCERLGIPYPGQDESGESDWGRSWNAVKDEFTDMVMRIVRTGRGLWFISHAKEKEITSRYGERYQRMGPSMTGQAARVIEALVDIYLYADYMRNRNNEVIRVIVCEGDDTVYAGHRQTAGKFPPLMPMPLKHAYDSYVRAFRGEHPGIDPSTLKPHRTTSPTVRTLVRGFSHREEEEERLPKKKAKKKKAKKRARKTPSRRRA